MAAVRRSCTHVLSTLHQLKTADTNGDTDRARELCSIVEDRWDEVQWVLKICVPYEKLSEAEKIICRLEPMLDSECSEFQAELVSAEVLLMQIYEGEVPYFTNIF